MNDQFVLHSEDKKTYVLKDKITGELKTLYKINKDDINKQRQIEIKKLSDALNETDINVLKLLLIEVSEGVDVGDWFIISLGIASELEELYKKVGSPNIFHHSIKNISPECYGSAKTFYKECAMIQDILNEI